MRNKSKAGQGLVEYALIILVIALIVLIVLSLTGHLEGVFNQITAALHFGGPRNVIDLGG